VEKASDSASSTLDRAVAAVQPSNCAGHVNSIFCYGQLTHWTLCLEDTKSTTQKVSDTTRGKTESAQHESKGMVQAVADTVASIAETASNVANGNNC
jgi:hypothetical protein